MTFAALRWINTSVTAAVLVAAAVLISAYEIAFYEVTFISGWLLFTSMIFLVIYSMRKKLTMLPIGSSFGWLQFHIYLGWFSVGMFLLHAGWRAPNGRMELLLYVMFIFVAGSGVIGVALSRALPRRLARRGEEVILERIPAFILALRQEAEELVLQSAGAKGSSSIRDLYSEHLRSFFDEPKNIFSHLFVSNRAMFSMSQQIDNVLRYLDKSETEFAEKLRELVKQKDDLDFHYALQTMLRVWLFIHVPATYGLLIAAAVHAVLVHAFGGGV